MYKTVTLAQKSTKISNPFTQSLHVIMGQLSQAIDRPAWGIDPGVNFGLTVIEKKKIWVLHGVLAEDNTPGRRGLIAYTFLKYFLSTYDHVGARMVIEGASYGDQFGQVLLSEIRTGFYLAASHSLTIQEVNIRAPKTIRKVVFGDGTIRAPDEWPTMNRNAADSLAMALAATMEDKHVDQ